LPVPLPVLVLGNRPLPAFPGQCLITCTKKRPRSLCTKTKRVISIKSEISYIFFEEAWLLCLKLIRWNLAASFGIEFGLPLGFIRFVNSKSVKRNSLRKMVLDGLRRSFYIELSSWIFKIVLSNTVFYWKKIVIVIKGKLERVWDKFSWEEIISIEVSWENLIRVVKISELHFINRRILILIPNYLRQ